jgi:hypothetical protein
MNQRRVSHGLVMLFKILNDLGPNYLRDMFTQKFEISERTTRSFEGNIWIGNNTYAAIHRKSFRIYISNLWNQLPDDVKTCKTVFSFKKKIKSMLLNNEIVLPPH